jgi:hypothetical protein
MFRTYWRRPRFWVWWFKRGAPSEVRWGLGLLAVVAVLGGGYLAADRLSAASAVSSGGAYTFFTTVDRNVTVRQHGRTLVTRVPVVHQVRVGPQTVVETRFRREPGRVVTNRVVRYVPVVKTHVVTSAGQARLVSRTVLVPTVSTRTATITKSQTATITKSQTVVDPTTSTVVTVVQTTVPVTVRQTDTATVVSTQKLPPETVTEPTHTVTVTRTVTTTVTSPAITVSTPVATVTVTVPKP